MNIWLNTLSHIGGALGELLLNPFFYICVLLIVLMYRRQIVVERKMFHTRLQGLGVLTGRNLLGGLLGGLAVSIVFMFVGVNLSIEAIYYVWIISFVLMLFSIRFVSLIYSVAILAILQFVFQLTPVNEGQAIIYHIQSIILDINIPALFCLAGLLYVVEAFLIKWQSAKLAGPIYIEGKRGRQVGGYQMHLYWVMPLLLIVPATSDGMGLPWTPFFIEGSGGTGYMLMGLPVMIGFTQIVMSSLPSHKVKLVSRRVFIYGLIVIAFSFISLWWSPFIVFTSILGIGLLEWLVWYGKSEERQQSPLFLHPQRGLKILAVQPDSPADQLGILPGETLLKINSMRLNNQEDLHAAIRVNPAFCKLEVLNYSGESKFLQRAIYDGDHHQLGMILVPDETSQEALTNKSLSLSFWQMLNAKRGLTGKRRALPSQYTNQSHSQTQSQSENQSQAHEQRDNLREDWPQSDQANKTIQS
ncbi:PDZ domain-containing protein [Paenibacillus turicensis]|uniref:PDZ domain-containing protein n=1 Tax=Paenibacillus turicensis TaxID=160487 RepID=UPI003D26763B